MKILRQPLTEIIEKEIKNLEVRDANIRRCIADTVNKIIKGVEINQDIPLNIRGCRFKTMEEIYKKAYLEKLRRLEANYGYNNINFATRIENLMEKIDGYS